MVVVASPVSWKKHWYLVKTNTLCPVLATDDMPTKVNMGMGLVLRPSNPGSIPKFPILAMTAARRQCAGFAERSAFEHKCERQ